MKRENNPKISVFNKQRKIPVDLPGLQSFLNQAACKMNLQEAFSVVLVGDSVIRRYNRQFRHQDKATDVLSFPSLEEPWERQDPDLGESYLGDILISVETANSQKAGTLLEELMQLSLHGLLHLLGYDHETDDGQMEALERELREDLGLH